MDKGIEDEISRYEKATERLIVALEKVDRGGATNTSSVYINAGGFGILVCSVLCAFMAGVALMIGNTQASQGNDIKSLHDYLSAIYQIAPQLKPKEGKEK